MNDQPAPVPFVPLSRGMIDGSLWEADLRVRVLFVTMLFISFEPARRGTVDVTLRKLAGRAGMSPEDVLYALGVLMAPDPDSRTPGDDGRRIERIDERRSWGWRIVNWKGYEEARERMLNAARQARFKAKHSAPGNATVTADNGRVTPTNVEGEVEVEVEVEVEESRGASAPLAPPTPPKRTRFVNPSEEEWTAYARSTWPDWQEHDIRSSWASYRSKGWKGYTDWKACAKTCYHRAAKAPAPRAGRPAPTLIGSHPPGPKLREIDEDSPEEIVEIVSRLRRREATDAEIATLDAWQRGSDAR